MLVGLWISGIGTDPFSTTSRFTFGRLELLSGIDFVVVAIGVFALGEVLACMEGRAEGGALPVPKGLRNLLPTLQDLKDCRFAFVNGSVLGFLIGVLPGAGSTIASFISYGVEKAVSRRPQEFGKGAVEGVAAPEGANNSETGGALVPLLTLGIPGSGTTAVLLAALVLWGFRPGPLFISENPSLFWGLVASMYIGNVMLLVLNLPLVPLFAQVLRTPDYVLYPLIIGISIVGVYSTSGSLFDVSLVVAFGVLGYLMRRPGPGRRHGARAAPVAHDVAGRSCDPRHSADQRRDARARGADPAHPDVQQAQRLAPAGARVTKGGSAR
jgi:putative tricarboxylic transport membrane protein